MRKFKSGDTVSYTNNYGEVSGPYIIDRIDVEGWVWFTHGTYGNANRVALWADPEPATTTNPVSWDYAVAQRLKDEAKAAVDAYNAYIIMKPTDVFIQVIQPFQ